MYEHRLLFLLTPLRHLLIRTVIKSACRTQKFLVLPAGYTPFLLWAQLRGASSMLLFFYNKYFYNY